MEITTKALSEMIAAAVAAALAGKEAEIEEVVEEEPAYDWTGMIGGRERHAMLTGGKTSTGYPLYKIVDDPEPVQGATAPEIVDGEEKDLPLTLNGALFFIQGGVVMANCLKNKPWKGVYHVYAYTDNPYTVLKEDDELLERLYGTLPDEPPEVTGADGKPKKAVTLKELNGE